MNSHTLAAVASLNDARSELGDTLEVLYHELDQAGEESDRVEQALAVLDGRKIAVDPGPNDELIPLDIERATGSDGPTPSADPDAAPTVLGLAGSSLAVEPDGGERATDEPSNEAGGKGDNPCADRPVDGSPAATEEGLIERAAGILERGESTARDIGVELGCGTQRARRLLECLEQNGRAVHTPDTPHRWSLDTSVDREAGVDENTVTADRVLATLSRLSGPARNWVKLGELVTEMRVPRGDIKRCLEELGSRGATDHTPAGYRPITPIVETVAQRVAAKTLPVDEEKARLRTQVEGVLGRADGPLSARAIARSLVVAIGDVSLQLHEMRTHSGQRGWPTVLRNAASEYSLEGSA